MVTLASSLMGGSVQAASRALLAPGAQARTVSVLGTEALCFYRLDKAEHARREEASAARLDHLADLESLLALPVGIPVLLGALDSAVRRAVRALPTGAAERDRKTVTRHAVRPLQVDLAVVRASNWRQGLERAGRFAPFCRRAMLLDRHPARLEEALAEADFYGIGVFLVAGNDVELALEPGGYRPPRHTAAAWWFVEDLYQRLRSASAV
ncbi:MULTISPECIES: hypothetical protein [unclassified Streptomyces]|uniref:hypothetical protein n=1 Tax=unclassified Streptomyces TaxID=2593676 RepID=UPI002257C264|nr:hypothetical protein [Streptomyces sp. NBC_00201]MCX5246685.1 hypothetical protein [Streptomyces sp. NBC_00201]